jgi:hypothetical protein
MARTLAMMTFLLSDRLSDGGSIASLHPISLSLVVSLRAVFSRLDANTKTNLIITKKQLCRHKLAAGSN